MMILDLICVQGGLWVRIAALFQGAETIQCERKSCLY